MIGGDRVRLKCVNDGTAVLYRWLRWISQEGQLLKEHKCNNKKEQSI